MCVLLYIANLAIVDLPVLFKYLLVPQTDSWNSFLMDITMKYTSVQYQTQNATVWMVYWNWFSF